MADGNPDTGYDQVMVCQIRQVAQIVVEWCLMNESNLAGRRDFKKTEK